MHTYVVYIFMLLLSLGWVAVAVAVAGSSSSYLSKKDARNLNIACRETVFHRKM